MEFKTLDLWSVTQPLLSQSTYNNKDNKKGIEYYFILIYNLF